MDYNSLIKQFDKLCYSGDFDSASKLLEDRKTVLINNKNTEELLAVNNELIGFYRKQNNQNKCLSTINDTLNILLCINNQNKLFYGTIYINIATGYSAFNFFDDAIKYFAVAEDIYNKVLDKNDKNFSALYNNIASMYLLKKEYVLAKKYYTLAVDIATYNNANLEKAMSLVGICDTYDATNLANEQIIARLLDEAFTLVDNYPIKDEYFAFVCSKLVDSFNYYGYFIQAEKLKNYANEIN